MQEVSLDTSLGRSSLMIVISVAPRWAILHATVQNPATKHVEFASCPATKQSIVKLGPLITVILRNGLLKRRGVKCSRRTRLRI